MNTSSPALAPVLFLVLVALPAPAFAGHVNPPWDHVESGESRFQLVLPVTRCVDGNCGPVATAVLDRETGLIWDQTPDHAGRKWKDAVEFCYKRSNGNRKGWRLPTVEELVSLVDPSRKDPALPAGHPIIGIAFPHHVFWTNTTAAGTTNRAWIVALSDGSLNHVPKTYEVNTFCVRGRPGYDGR